jgi:hypothetical protein
MLIFAYTALLFLQLKGGTLLLLLSGISKRKASKLAKGSKLTLVEGTTAWNGQ